MLGSVFQFSSDYCRVQVQFQFSPLNTVHASGLPCKNESYIQPDLVSRCSQGHLFSFDQSDAKIIADTTMSG